MINIMQYYDKKQREDRGAFDDVNRSLFVALFATDLYGKISYEEEVLNIIIGGNTDDEEKQIIEREKKFYEQAIKSKEFKLDKKSGMYLDKQGCFVLKRV